MIPDRLKDRDKWVCWRFENKTNRDKPAKVPVSATDPAGGRVDVTDPVNWSDLETAQKAVNTHSEVEGIGFVFNTDGPLMGIDLDNCRVPEAIHPWAESIIDRLDSFTCVSQSGTGVHIYVIADLPDGGNRSGDVEMYDGNRFFAFTGDWIASTPESVKPAQDAVNAVHDEWVLDGDDDEREGYSTPQPSLSDSLNLDDRELVEKAKHANDTGRRFTKLWNGNYSHQPSHSEARLELYNYLAFWTGKDERQMWRLFRQSGLYPHPDKPGKCERVKDREIAKAVNDTRNSYSGAYHSDKLPEETKQMTADGGKLAVSDPTVAAVVEVLEDRDSATTSEIESHPVVDRGVDQVRRAIQHLEDLGMVDYERSGRSVSYYLTDG